MFKDPLTPSVILVQNNWVGSAVNVNIAKILLEEVCIRYVGEAFGLARI